MCSYATIFDKISDASKQKLNDELYKILGIAGSLQNKIIQEINWLEVKSKVDDFCINDDSILDLSSNEREKSNLKPLFLCLDNNLNSQYLSIKNKKTEIKTGKETKRN